MKLDRRFAKYIYWLLLPAALIIRVFQLLLVVDIDTGFYEAGHPLSYALSAVMVAGILLVGFTVIFGSSKNTQVGGTQMKNPFLTDLDTLAHSLGATFSVSVMTMSFALVLDAILQFFEHMAQSAVTPVFLLNFAFMLATAAVFLRIAFACMKGRPLSRAMGYSLLLPVIWYTIRSTEYFMSFIQITNISENLLLLLSSLSTLLFLVLCARFFSGYEKNNTRPMLIITGLTCSLVCAVSTVPRYVMIYFGPTGIRQATRMPMIEDLIMAVIAASVAFVLLGANQPVDAATAGIIGDAQPDENKKMS